MSDNVARWIDHNINRRHGQGIGTITKPAGLRDRDGNKVRLSDNERKIADQYKHVTKRADDFLAEHDGLYWDHRTGERFLDVREQDVDTSRHPDAEYWGHERLSPEERQQRLDALSDWCSSAYDESNPPVVLDRQYDNADTDNPNRFYPCRVYGIDGRYRHTVYAKAASLTVKPKKSTRRNDRQARKAEQRKQRNQRYRNKGNDIATVSDALIRAERAREDMKRYRQALTRQYAVDYELQRTS